MNRFHISTALAALGLVLAACGPAASSNSGQPSRQESSAGSAAESQAQASAGGGEPSFSAGVVGDLEALIPDTVSGITVTKASMSGDQFLTAPGSDPATIQFLQELGISTSDVSVATGYAIAPDGSFSMAMFVIRAAGADSARLVSALKTAYDANSDTPLVWSSATVAGKSVETATISGQTIYLYAKGDVLFFFSATGTGIAEEVFSGLP